MKFLEQFKAARRVSTPIIAVRTPDPAATIALIAKSYNGTAPPIMQWDIVRGLQGLNDLGKQALTSLGMEPSMTTNLVDTLGRLAESSPMKVMLFCHNVHRIIGEQGMSQAIWNVRDAFKQGFRTLVLMAPAIDLPAEISQDVLVLDEPLPTQSEIEEIVKDVFRSAEMDPPADMQPILDALCGLAAFPVEQVTAMSLTKDGIDMDELWERKRKMIEQTPGLNVWRGGETFEEIGGCDNAKEFMRRIIAGKEAPRAFVFLDEIEKQFAGNGTDTSGVSTEMTGTLLSYMQDNNAKGVIFIGPPGAAKSAIAKATGNTAGKPTIQFDLSAMKGSLVGESGRNLRQALKVVEAVAQGKAMFIATCNSIGVLPPELRRRFTFGTFFFDLPTDDERYAIWQLYCKKFGIGGETPDDAGWTGAEIKMCCDIAWRLNCSLVDAAKYIVPVAKSAGDQIEKLRQQANGRFICASKPGIYRYEKPTASSSRSIEMEA